MKKFIAVRCAHLVLVITPRAFPCCYGSILESTVKTGCRITNRSLQRSHPNIRTHTCTVYTYNRIHKGEQCGFWQGRCRQLQAES